MTGARVAQVTVGVDIGTTSVKAIAVDEDGCVLARARVNHQVRTPAPGVFEHDVDRAWRADVLDALAQVATGLDVAAVNVAAMVPSLAAVDRSGSALSPGLLYGDHRGVTSANDPEAGDSGELIAFLAWLCDHAPDAAAYWPAQAVANHALTGVGAIDSATAMTAMPLFDRGGWDEQRAHAAGASTSALPAVVAGVEPIGRVLDGLPAAGALVGAGTIDALGEQVVAGAERTGDILVICGATIITWAVLDDWQTVPGLWTIPHTTRNKVLLGGPSNAGGMFIDRVGQWLGPTTPEELDALDPADLPVWLPYLRGERSPLHRRDLRGGLHDAAVQHEVAHLRRAAYEASAFVVRHHLDLASAVGPSPRRIVATGGGTRSTQWMQALADATGLAVEVAAVPEGGALGSAFMARCVAGDERRLTDARRWARTARTVEPDPRWVEPTDRRYRRFRELTDAAVDAARVSPSDESQR